MDVGIVLTVISIVISIIGIVVGYLSYRLKKLSERFPRLIKQYLLITAQVPHSPPFKTYIRVHNTGDLTAHNFRLHVRFPPGAEIKEVDEGVFKIAEMEKGLHSVKFAKDQVAPRTAYPAISISAEKDGESVPPETIFAESDEIPKFPVRWVRGSKEVI